MNEMVLYYICEGAGLLMVVGGIWLIYRQKIFLDPQTNEVLSVELPFFGKLKTNVPALGLFVLGLIPLIYPIAKLTTRYLQVEQDISSDDHPVEVYVAVQAKILHEDGKLIAKVPVLDVQDYSPELIYWAGPVTAQYDLELGQAKHGTIVLQPKQIQDKANHGVTKVSGEIVPRPRAY